MIYFTHEIQYYLRDVNEIFCCNCVFSKLFFLIKEKKEEKLSEIIGEKKVKVYVRFFDGTLVYTCSDFLEFLYLERNISNLISCKKAHISNICSICYIDLSRALKVLNHFYKKDEC